MEHLDPGKKAYQFFWHKCLPQTMTSVEVLGLCFGFSTTNRCVLAISIKFWYVLNFSTESGYVSTF